MNEWQRNYSSLTEHRKLVQSQFEEEEKAEGMDPQVHKAAAAAGVLVLPRHDGDLIAPSIAAREPRLGGGSSRAPSSRTNPANGSRVPAELDYSEVLREALLCPVCQTPLVSQVSRVTSNRYMRHVECRRSGCEGVLADYEGRMQIPHPPQP